MLVKCLYLEAFERLMNCCANQNIILLRELNAAQMHLFLLVYLHPFTCILLFVNGGIHSCTGLAGGIYRRYLPPVFTGKYRHGQYFQKWRLPAFTGSYIICESYANENKILFNASKSQILHFSKNEDSENNRKPQLRMNNGQLIPYVEKCIHLGNILSSTSREQAMITSSITDLNIKTNNLLSEFSFNESTTLSRLFRSYCMNVYGSSLWRYNNLRNIERFCISWQKAIRKLWKIPYRTHNDLVYLINKCDPIVSILEKRCAKFLWNLFNSDNVLFSRICRYSVYNSDTAMGENIRYFMYKYNISYNDWYGNFSNIYVKIDTHVRSVTNYDNICIAGAIRELCEARDCGVPQFVDATQLNSMIDILCTK